MSKGSAIISILIAFVGGVLIGHLTGSAGTGGDEQEVGAAADEGGPLGPAPDDGIERFRVPVTDEQPVKGPADALVTIVEFSDFECPFCSRVGPTISRLMNEYRGKVRVVWRNNPLPFHQNAGPAANAAMEAFEQGGSEKFWAMHDKLFENQRALGRADLERYAQELGLNMQQFRAALDNNEHNAGIQADQALSNQVDARGTPHFFINGRKLAGAQPYEEFQRIVDEEIRTAEAIVEGGTPATRVYATLLQNARENAAAAAPGAAPGAQPAQPQPDPAAVYRVPISGEPQKGPNDALVTIVEVSDFECPFCSRVEPTMASIVERYGRDVRIVWMNNPLPFHSNAGPAAQAALEAFDQGGNDKFWAMHAKLFENQRALTRPDLERYAQELGLNMAQFRAALDGNEHAAVIERHQTLARQLGASGTPSFFINGRNLRGAQPLEAFTAIIDEEMTKARAKVAAGTPRARVYEETIRDGHTSQQMLAAPAGAPAAAPAAAPTPPPDQVYEIAVPRDAPSKGPANARVTIQEFSDFQCPFCGRVNPTIQQIQQEYGNRVRIVWRNFPLPFHTDAPLAHEAAWEVFRQGGSEKFWAYHDKLFENQRALTRPDLERYAQELGGVDMAQFRSALDTRRHQARMQQDVDAVNAAGARIGTPSFFINGRLVQGAQPFDAFKAAIDRALAGD
jgi:protein-disulfide isomerase